MPKKGSEIVVFAGVEVRGAGFFVLLFIKELEAAIAGGLGGFADCAVGKVIRPLRYRTTLVNDNPITLEINLVKFIFLQ
ncbi:MAG: hypothetical protein SFU91_13325 [Chloroherpetonaceae bacterium]|nr:hypothetical protein [Chloroherpetonaceae bacterium]